MALDVGEMLNEGREYKGMKLKLKMKMKGKINMNPPLYFVLARGDDDESHVPIIWWLREKVSLGAEDPA